MIFKGKKRDYLFDKMGEVTSREQFPYSERLLDLRIQGLEGSSMSDWDFGKMAEMVGMTEDEYLKYEYADDDISVLEYKEVIKRLTVKMLEEEQRLKEPEEVNVSTGDLSKLGEKLGLTIILYNEVINYNATNGSLDVELYVSVKDKSLTLEDYNKRDRESFIKAKEELRLYGWGRLKHYEDRYVKKVVIKMVS